MSTDKETIRQRALELISEDDRRVGARMATEFGMSRQVANGYLQTMARDELIDAEGTTRARVHRRKTLDEVGRRYPREGLEEHTVAGELVNPVVAEFAENVKSIWHYASTEMINNAIDHSGSNEIEVRVFRNALCTEVDVADEGEGIFLKIQRTLGLHDPREALLELAKGKLTTATERHTGEGIFFTPGQWTNSRSFHAAFASVTHCALTTYLPIAARTNRAQACACASPTIAPEK